MSHNQLRSLVNLPVYQAPELTAKTWMVHLRPYTCFSAVENTSLIRPIISVMFLRNKSFLSVYYYFLAWK